ncbi:MAG: 2-hydroxyacyl-CoA dehydratase family protein [Eubacterium sp.]|nr:2-hydroxyacyl-CoA dehydratase family protein [Eubacterium sp.]
MADLVKKYGGMVDALIEAHPTAARRMLLAGYYAKRVQLKRFPLKGLSPARNDLAVTSMDAVIAPLRHPEQAALVSIFTPCELLHTFGIHPMLAEAMSSYINGTKAESGFIAYAQACGLPETFCSYHKVLLGGILSDVIPKPQFILNTSLVCDANCLTFRKAAEHWQIPQFFIDVPYDSTEENIAYVETQLREFAAWLEEACGRKLDEEKLKEHVASGGRTMQALARCQELKKEKYLSNDLTDEMYEVFANHVLLGMPEVERFALQLEKDLAQAAPTKGIRILWMHTIPYYQEDLRALFNFSDRCQIIACDMNYDEYCEADPEKPFASMARRLVQDAFNGPAENRIRRSLEMCRRLDIDGVVYFCHWGCKQTLSSAQIVRHTMEEAGYPTLILDGDGCDADNMSNGQILTRMEAFLEMLEEKAGG